MPQFSWLTIKGKFCNLALLILGNGKALQGKKRFKYIKMLKNQQLKIHWRLKLQSEI